MYSKTLQKCAVCMAVMDGDGRLLVTRRVKNMRIFPWAWVLPGGHIDPGEKLEESVRREIAEETGINIESSGEGGDSKQCTYDG